MDMGGIPSLSIWTILCVALQMILIGLNRPITELRNSRNRETLGSHTVSHSVTVHVILQHVTLPVRDLILFVPLGRRAGHHTRHTGEIATPGHPPMVTRKPRPLNPQGTDLNVTVALQDHHRDQVGPAQSASIVTATDTGRATVHAGRGETDRTESQPYQPGTINPHAKDLLNGRVCASRTWRDIKALCGQNVHGITEEHVHGLVQASRANYTNTNKKHELYFDKFSSWCKLHNLTSFPVTYFS